MADERIDSIIDVAAVKKEFEQVAVMVKELADNIAGMAKSNASLDKVLGNAQTPKEVAAAVEKVAASTEKLKTETQKLTAEQSAMARLEKQLIRAKVQQSEEGKKVTAAIQNERMALRELQMDQQKSAKQMRSQTDYAKAFSYQLDTASIAFHLKAFHRNKSLRSKNRWPCCVKK